jgi:GT2 family glycosyltransferase
MRTSWQSMRTTSHVAGHAVYSPTDRPLRRIFSGSNVWPVVVFAVRNLDDRERSRARALDPAGTEEAALCWSADRVVELLPAPEPPEKARLYWGFDAGSDPAYGQWLRDFERDADASARALPSHGPLVSVVVPVYRPKLWYFEVCVGSVRAQRYESWELCLCDDASNDSRLSALLADLADSDPRIKVLTRQENGGISRATNDALSLATGEFVAFLDHDDVIDPDALGEMAAAFEAEPDTDVLYSDEDTTYGEEEAVESPLRRFRPCFKPDWAPDLLLTYPYLGHLLLVRRALVSEIGGLRPAFDGSQDYDVMLRATEQARRIAHVPKILYHWRAVAGSAADDRNAKPWAHVASRRAVEDAVRRRGIDAVVEDGPGQGWYHVRRRVIESPSVTIIIPFRDQAQMTARCLTSLGVAPGYENFEVLLVDNQSTEPEVRALRKRLQQGAVRVMDFPEEFNWSVMNNMAASSCDSDLLLFMNNDMEAIKPGWLRALVELAQREDVGAVGARLLYPDGVLQHAGVTLGLDSVAGHLFAGMPVGRVGYMSWDRVVRPYSAVTGACLMSSRKAFEEVGGFDENLEVAYNDVDYCMRLLDVGYKVLYTPHAELVHYESASRGISGSFGDARYFLGKWGRERLLHDPFYNPNLSLFGTWCRLRHRDDLQNWERGIDTFTRELPGGR